MNTRIKVLPIPDEPNINGITCSKESLESAVNDYNNKEHRYLYIGEPKFPNVRNEHNIVGTVDSIEYDESTGQYIGNISFIDSDLSRLGMSSISNETHSLHTNKLGHINNFMCDDPDLEIYSIIIDIDPT